MRLHLVRHGPPRIDPATSPHEWHLDQTRLQEVTALAASGVLPTGARWLSSDEPKAVETAELLGAPHLEVVPGLREQGRPVGWFDDYAVHIHRALVRQDEPAGQGWETAAATRARVVAVVRELLDGAGGRGRARDHVPAGASPDVVLVGHGMAWTLLVSELTGTGVDLAAWERMRMPDHCVIEGGVVVSDWGQWQRPVTGTPERS